MLRKMLCFNCKKLFPAMLYRCSFQRKLTFFCKFRNLQPFLKNFEVFKVFEPKTMYKAHLQFLQIFWNISVKTCHFSNVAPISVFLFLGICNFEIRILQKKIKRNFVEILSIILAKVLSKILSKDLSKILSKILSKVLSKVL